MLYLRAKLHTWYKTQGILDEAKVYAINKLTVGMLGGANTPKLRSKAAEARCLLGWVHELLLEFGHLFAAQGAFLLNSVESLRAFYQLISSEARVMSHETRTKSKAFTPPLYFLWVSRIVVVAVSLARYY